MRLSQPPESETRPHDVTAPAFAALDARLCRDTAAPVCVAVSGGGDSMALLALTCDWARTRGRRVLALSVDHGLQAEGAAWSRAALAAAEALGARGELLRWEGPKPQTGLPAAARAARHRLLAQAARAAGASVILLGHTADDIAEGELMREEGSNLGRLAEWGPSPAWPQGRGVFLFRPLLGVRREALRRVLREAGLGWIEDPANEDPKYARARARQSLQQCPHPGIREANVRDPASAAFEAGVGRDVGRGAAGSRTGLRPSGMRELLEGVGEVGGGLALSRSVLAAAPPQAARRFLSAALLSAAGTTRPPRSDSLEALLGRLAGSELVAATLAGAKILADGEEVILAREMPRGGLPPLPLAPGIVSVWDGRLEILTDEPGLSAVPAQGRMAQLSAADRKELQGLAPVLRASQPLLIGRDEAGVEARPVLARRLARLRALAPFRLRAACGGVAHEREIDHGVVAPGGGSSYIGVERS